MRCSKGVEIMSNKEKPVSNKIKNTDEKMMKVVSHVLLIVLCVFCVGSFLLVLGSSFQSESEIQKIGYRMIPQEFSLEAYKAVFMSPGMIFGFIYGNDYNNSCWNDYRFMYFSKCGICYFS